MYRLGRTLLTLAAGLTFMAVQADTYVLQMGVNDYPGDDEDLYGCVNDVTALKGVLTESFGVKADNIKTLTDKGATQEGFMDGVKWLIQSTKAGDQVIFQYSGHGAQIDTKDLDKEPDGKEEVIVLSDDTAIPGSFFHDWALDFKSRGVDITFILDSCFSGGMSRNPSQFQFGGKTLTLDRTSQRFLSSPVALNKVRRMDDQKLKTLRDGVTVKPKSATGGSFAFLMAAAEDKPSSDVRFQGDEPAHGIFTYILLAALHDMKDNGLEDIMAVIEKILKDNKFEQGPNSEYSTDERGKLPLVIKS